LRRVFKCQDIDRLPIRIWGVDPLYASADPSWQPLYEMTEQYELDIIRSWSPTVVEEPAPPAPTSERRDSPKPGMWEVATVIATPGGPLTQVCYQPKSGAPGYIKEHYIETVADARRWLSLPRGELQVSVEGYAEVERQTGDRALLMVGLGEAMYAIQGMMGSELFGFWLRDERELLREMIEVAQAPIEAVTKACLAAGVGDAYGWVGPELCIPPLASPQDLRDFVVPYDGRIIELVRDAGRLTWIHCHGDMHTVLEDFVAMGLDCLNPIEPPPVGRLTLAEAKARVAGRMCLEGGIEDGDFDLCTPREIAAKTEAVIAQGRPGGGFILCPTSSPTTWLTQSERHIANYRAYIETAARLAEYE
jgi:hypothetical protein